MMPEGSLAPTMSNAHSTATAIPPAYWNLSGALYAYVYVELSKLGIDVATVSQLLGFPRVSSEEGQLQATSAGDDSLALMDWSTGKPNARFHMVQLLKNNFARGDKLVSTRFNS